MAAGGSQSYAYFIDKRLIINAAYAVLGWTRLGALEIANQNLLFCKSAIMDFEIDFLESQKDFTKMHYVKILCFLLLLDTM